MYDLSKPRGTRDFSPSEMSERRRIEDGMRRLLICHGYGEIQTPTFEHADLFIARSGPQILGQLYDFRDKSDRHMALRPELTAPVMRFYSTDLKSLAKPLRVFYFGNCFRYERPQKGRFREFWQFGMEYIGRRTALACSEVISIAMRAIEEAGVDDFTVRIGHVGIVRSVMEAHGIDVSGNRDLMSAIDKKDIAYIEELLKPKLGAEVKKLLSILTSPTPKADASDRLSEMMREYPGIEEMISGVESVFRLMDDDQGRVFFDPSITRGLDYYDGIVFEVDIPTLGAEKQVCGGGEYSLANVFGSDVEGIGFGIGFDRVMMARGAGTGSDVIPQGFYVIPMDESAWSFARKVQREMTSNGMICLLEAQGRGLKKALSSAATFGTKYAVIIGGDEMESGKVSLKDLLTGDQRRVSTEDLKALKDQ